jgi:hypothetical protein
MIPAMPLGGPVMSNVRRLLADSGKLLAMGKRYFLTCAVIVMISCISVPAQDLSNAPKSADYPARNTYRGKLAPVIFDSRRARLYRTVLREGAKKGPNFAGHYTLVAWGCGLGAFSMAVIDAKTGRVYFPPFKCVDGADFGLPLADKGNNPAFRIDSKLFVFVGSRDEEERTAMYFYIFDKNRFKLVHFIKEKKVDSLITRRV